MIICGLDPIKQSNQNVTIISGQITIIMNNSKFSWRENSLFAPMPQRSSSLGKSNSDQFSRDSKLSHYSKIMSVDGIKNGDIALLQKGLQKQAKNSYKNAFRLCQSNKFLNHLLGSVKNKFKDEFKQKNRGYDKQDNQEGMRKRSSSNSFSQYNQYFYDGIQKGIKVQSKQLLQTNYQKSLKNKKLINLKKAKYFQNTERLNLNQTGIKELDYNTINDSQSNRIQYGNIIGQLLADQNEQTYLTGQKYGIKAKTEKQAKQMFKTEEKTLQQFQEEMKKYYQIHARKDTSRNQLPVEQPYSQSDGIRAISALQIMNIAKLQIYPKSNINSVDIGQKHSSRIKQFTLDKRVNQSAQLTKNMPKKTSIHSRKDYIKKGKRNTANNISVYNYFSSNKGNQQNKQFAFMQ